MKRWRSQSVAACQDQRQNPHSPPPAHSEPKTKERLYLQNRAVGWLGLSSSTGLTDFLDIAAWVTNEWITWAMSKY